MFFLGSCKNDSSENEFLATYLSRSENIKMNIIDTSFSGIYSNAKIILEYSSISESDFIKEIKKVKYALPFFLDEYWFEPHIEEGVFRKGDTLVINTNSGLRCFIDNQERPVKKYLYYKRLESFHFVKEFAQWDSFSHFLSDDCPDFSLSGVGGVSNESGSLLFFSNHEQYYKDSTVFSILKLKECTIDTLVFENFHWFSRFSFFNDKDELFVSCISFDENGHYISFPIKMKIYLK